MTKIIAVASGKGGVGKTTAAINLGTALTAFRREAIVVDGNLKTPNVGIYLGAPVVPNSVHDAVNNKKNMRECVYRHPSGVQIAPASISLDDARNTDHNNFGKALKELDGTTEIIIVDSIGGLDDAMFSSVGTADEVIIVATPDLPSITDSLKAIHMMDEKGITVIGVLLNMIRGDKYELSIDEIETLLELPVIASVPYDKRVREAFRENNPVVYSDPNSKAAIEYKKLAALLIGQKYEVLTKKK